jgi:hypothetical protein
MERRVDTEQPRDRGPGPRPVTEWFTREPYPGVWACLAILVFILAFSIVASQPRQEAPRMAAATPPAGQPDAPQAPAYTEPEIRSVEPPRGDETPRVTVREIPGPEPGEPSEEAGAGTPAANAPPRDPAANLPSQSAAAGNGPPANRPAAARPSVQPDEPATPPEPPEAPAATRDSIPPPRPQPAPDTIIVPTPTAPEPPAPQPRPRIARPEPQRAPPRRVVVPRRPTGNMRIYFDADSTTFGRAGRRLPLRVEVYVDGVKRLEDGDPEKREFDLGRLPEGQHEVEIVPFVGDAPTQPRRRTVYIEGGRESRYRAVLRRTDGVSQVRVRADD